MAETTTKKKPTGTKKKSTSTTKKTTTTTKKAAEKKVTEPIAAEPAAEELKINIVPEVKNDELETLKEEVKAKDEKISELESKIEMILAEVRQSKPQIVQIANDAEKVYLRWQCECADNNVVEFGPGGIYGSITGKTGDIIVPKSEWSRFATESVQRMLKRRNLIVLSGFSEEERKVYGIDYKDGELIDRKAFAKLLDMGRELLAIYPALCPAHKEMIARRFVTGYEQGNKTAHDRDLVTALNELSKKDFKDAPKSDPRRRGLFSVIIDAMNAKDAE